MTSTVPRASRTPGTGPAARSRWVALALLASAQLMLVLDVTVVNVALPDIGAALHLHRGALPWVMTAYTLVFGGLMLLAGRIADLFAQLATPRQCAVASREATELARPRNQAGGNPRCPKIKATTIDPVPPHEQATRQARRRSALRANSAAICVMLLAQYGLGMAVNLYAQVPAADHGTGLAVAAGRALTSQPAVLAAHTVLGLLMLVAGISVLARAIHARHRRAIAASAAGLAAIVAAAFSGAAFVSNGQAGASMAMAVLTGVALLCYLANLLMVSPAVSRAAVNSPDAEHSPAADVSPAAAIKE